MHFALQDHNGRTLTYSFDSGSAIMVFSTRTTADNAAAGARMTVVELTPRNIHAWVIKCRNWNLNQAVIDSSDLPNVNRAPRISLVELIEAVHARAG
jgi:hypothetical protein